MSDKALFEVTLKDGQKFNAFFRTGWMSSSSDVWLFCTIFGNDTHIPLENVASVAYAAGIHHTTEECSFVTKEDGYRHYTYGEVTDQGSVKSFPWRNAEAIYDDVPAISRSDYTYVGNAVFREVTWGYVEKTHIDADSGIESITHRYLTYMTASDYRRLMAQWGRAVADVEIEYAER